MRSSGSMEIVMMLIICYSEVVSYVMVDDIKSKSCKKNHPDDGLEYVQQAVFLHSASFTCCDNPIFLHRGNSAPAPWLGDLRFAEFPWLFGRNCSYILPQQDGGTSQI